MQTYLIKIRFLRPAKLADIEFPTRESTEIVDTVDSLLQENLLVGTTSEFSLTVAGRKLFTVVFTGGTYDILHVGHLKTLREAKSLADLLVVIVARDNTVQSRKRDPINSENYRRELLDALDYVDAALLGHKYDHLTTVRQVNPDYIAIGADQHHKIPLLQRQLAERGLGHIQFVRLTADQEGLSTTDIINKIHKLYCEKSNNSKS